MELDILGHSQRKLPYASLGLYTFAISTPIILLCKNRFLHVKPNMSRRAYKLMALRSQKTNEISFQTNSSLNQISRPLFLGERLIFFKKGKVVLREMSRMSPAFCLMLRLLSFSNFG